MTQMRSGAVVGRSGNVFQRFLVGISAMDVVIELVLREAVGRFVVQLAPCEEGAAVFGMQCSHVTRAP